VSGPAAGAADLVLDPPAWHARYRPDAVALSSGDDGWTVTWAGLDRRVGRIAALLDGRGVGPGDRVAVLADGDPRVFELQFACMRLGAVLVPLNWRLAVPELVDLLVRSRPVLLVHDERFAQEAGRTGAALLGWTADHLTGDYDRAAASGAALPGGPSTRPPTSCTPRAPPGSRRGHSAPGGRSPPRPSTSPTPPGWPSRAAITSTRCPCSTRAG
jgi:acyl-CoA synthetase (AMP-forming)/AMP-acid ligase II